MATSRKKFKVVLLGEGRVGKTSLLIKYIHGTFTDRQQSTVQASFLEKSLTIGSNAVSLMIWDTAGQERFHALAPIYYRDADGAILVYDQTDQTSFEKVKHWISELKKFVGKNITLVIAANKSDMKNKEVSFDEALDYSHSVNASLHSTSAKSGSGVEDCFLELTKGLLKKSSRKKKKPQLIIDDESEADFGGSKKGGSCC